MKILAKALVVGEEKSVIGAQRPAERRTKLIALKWRSRALVEEIRSIEGIVPQEFEGGAMPTVRAGASRDEHLGAGVLAKFRAVRIALHVELAHGIHAQQHAARPSRLHVVFGRAGEFHSVEQEQVLLRAVAGDGKIVCRSGVGDPRAAGFLRSEIHDARIQGEKQVKAAAVEREFLHLLLCDET